MGFSGDSSYKYHTDNTVVEDRANLEFTGGNRAVVQEPRDNIPVLLPLRTDSNHNYYLSGVTSEWR